MYEGERDRVGCERCCIVFNASWGCARSSSINAMQVPIASTDKLKLEDDGLSFNQSINPSKDINPQCWRSFEYL